MINISQATLDVIEAIQTHSTIKFKYGSHNEYREVEPTEFFGDFEGFGGVDIALEDDNYRKFLFHRVTEWIGVKDKRHELECALREAREITKEAKYLCYPVGEITAKLSSLAHQHGLLDEMNELLDQVTSIEHNLESAFYECESVFEEALSDLELQEYND